MADKKENTLFLEKFYVDNSFFGEPKRWQLFIKIELSSLFLWEFRE